jgi:glycosyltransferase involved in cell wall biosynthesis
VKPKLSILICTYPKRADDLARLLDILSPQLTRDVQVLVDDGLPHNVETDIITIGDKRNRLLDAADGEYGAFVDDDDIPSPAYCQRILEALRTNPDCVGFTVNRFQNGRKIGVATHSMRFDRCFDWHGYGSVRIDRVPNHLNPVKMSLMRQVRFKSLNTTEDRDYAERLRPLLKTEVFIDEPLYDYMRIPKKVVRV